MPSLKFKVEWSDDDAVYVARVDKFPYISTHGDTPEDAMREIRVAVQGVQDGCRHKAEPLVSGVPWTCEKCGVLLDDLDEPDED